ncbi:Hypothetical predicted protein [Lecanosticta acicola]|uniref:UBL3-like ubiquitin domain-containing protein n=1 Tax=Lecanosticta acicola TaxID=111012 RepID=A0AAI9E9A6_9PEZI|nr:Hypothetical predicted protein [Lecanosticta acicola]
MATPFTQDPAAAAPAPSSSTTPAETEPSPSAPTPTTTTTTTTAPEPRVEQPTHSIASNPINAQIPGPGPSLEISLLLVSGARHPYRIDEKYLLSRNVTNAQDPATGTFDPLQISGYQLKELILKDWRSEWEPKPASPSSIRLIIMGRMIEDKAALKDFPFSPTSPNVVHLSVKPPEIPDDEDAGGKGGSAKGGALRQRDGEDGGAGCRCVIL